METFDTLLAKFWSDITQWLKDRNSRYHCPTLAYVHKETIPEIATVVLREAHPPTSVVGFHTDIRSLKARTLVKQPNLAFHFYSPEDKKQYRLNVHAKIHHLDEITQVRWQQASRSAKYCYASSLGPGEDLSAPPSHDLSEDEAYQNFAVERGVVNFIDILLLNHTGHERFILDLGSGSFKSIHA